MGCAGSNRRRYSVPHFGCRSCYYWSRCAGVREGVSAFIITREWFEQNSDLAQLLWAEMHIREYEKLSDPAGVWALVADEKGKEHILPSNRVFVPTTKEIPLSDA